MQRRQPVTRRRAVIQDEDKFVSTAASHHVFPVQRFLQALGNFPDGDIPEGMPHRVVHQLEVIQVKKYDPKWWPVWLSGFDYLREPRAQSMTIGERSEGIMASLEFQGLLIAPHLCNVIFGSDKVGDLAHVVAHRGNVDARPVKLP